MPIDPTQLKSELTADPLSLGYAPLVTAGNDQGLADLLNAKAYTATRPVPIGELQALMLQQQAWPRIRLAAQQATPPTGLDQPTWDQVRGACVTAVDLLLSYKAENVHTTLPAFVAAVGGLNAAGLLSGSEKAAIEALAVVPASRAEVLWGYGAVVTPEQCGAAR